MSLKKELLNAVIIHKMLFTVLFLMSVHGIYNHIADNLSLASIFMSVFVVSLSFLSTCFAICFATVILTRIHQRLKA